MIYLYIKKSTRGTKALFSPHCALSEENKAAMYRYIERYNYSYSDSKIEYIPNSCIKKMFGSDTWTGYKSL